MIVSQTSHALWWSSLQTRPQIDLATLFPARFEDHTGTTTYPVIASDSAFRGRVRQSHLQLKDHPSTALRVTLDEIATPAFGGFAMTVPRDVDASKRACEPQGHNFANREIRIQRNNFLRCGDRVFRLGHRSVTPSPYPRDLKITRAQEGGRCGHLPSTESKPPGHTPAFGEIKTRRNVTEKITGME